MARPIIVPSSKINQVAERFWVKVNISDPDSCWNWNAGFFSNGYGQFWLNGSQYKSNRVALFLHQSKLDATKDVLHSCDNKACCNPSHLREGTHIENMADRTERGHTLRGEKNPKAKLTVEQVREIRVLEKTLSRYRISKMYPVSYQQIKKILDYDHWWFI